MDPGLIVNTLLLTRNRIDILHKKQEEFLTRDVPYFKSNVVDK